MSSIYTPLETVILQNLKDNIDQEDGVAPMTLLMECVGTTVAQTDLLRDLEKTLLVLVREGLVDKFADYDTQGIYTVTGYYITRDGLRAVRLLDSSDPQK